MVPFELPVGIRHPPTKASMSTSWREAHLMRWVGGQLQPVGGWTKLNYVPTASNIRKIHVWTSNAGQRHTAYLCERHCYVDRGDGVLFDITPAGGMASPTNPEVGGYGDDLYSFGTYGTPRPTQDVFRPLTPAYSMDNWGEDLLFMTSADGRLLRWKPAAPSVVSEATLNAPIGNRSFVVTPERFVILFGMGGDFSRFGWCSREDIEQWTPGITTTAGSYNIEPKTPIVSACVIGNETLMFAALRTYVIRYIGLPYVYVYSKLSHGATPISFNSISAIPDGAFWMSESGPWRYNGQSIIPVDCPIWEWISDDFDTIKARFNAFVVDIVSPSETWWFFPSLNSPINNRVAIHNYRENWWTMGRLGRTAGYSASYTDLPLMADGTRVYEHEKGDTFSGTDPAWIESNAFNFEDGNQLVYVDRMIPDVEGDPSSLNFSFYMNMVRSDSANNPERLSSPKVINGHGFLNVRETARDFRMRVQAKSLTTPRWTLGQTLIEAKPRGQQ